MFDSRSGVIVEHRWRPRLQKTERHYIIQRKTNRLSIILLCDKMSITKQGGLAAGGDIHNYH